MTPKTIGILIYRRFEIRAEQLVCVPQHMQGLWRPYWRELPDGRWIEGRILCDTEADGIHCARQCVDYQYRTEVWEFLNERKYDPMKDDIIKEFT